MGVTNTSLHFLPDFLPHRNPLHRKRACRLLEKPRSTSVWNLRRIVNKNWIQKDCDLNRFCSCVITTTTIIHHHHHHHHNHHHISSSSPSSPQPSSYIIIITIIITTIIVYRQHHHQAAFWLPRWHSTTPSVDVIQDTPTIHPPAPQTRKTRKLSKYIVAIFLGLVLILGI